MAAGLIVAVFPSRKQLIRALDHVQHDPALGFRRAAVVAKAGSGETVILDDDISPDEGGIAGGTLGAAMTMLGIVQMGALALPGVGPVIALGAAALVGGLVGGMTGRFAANLLDFGFKNEQIATLSNMLEEGHPALLLEVDDAARMLDRLQEALKPYQAELIAPLHRAAYNPPSDME